MPSPFKKEVRVMLWVLLGPIALGLLATLLWVNLKPDASQTPPAASPTFPNSVTQSADSTPSGVPTTAYRLGARKVFENDIYTVYCNELTVNGNVVGWVGEVKSTRYGLVTQVCEEQTEPYAGAATAGAVYGDVKDGWYLVSLVDGSITKLSLPKLGYFSNPAFCDRFGAYWNAETEPSVLVADLGNRKILREVRIGPLVLETDDPGHLKRPNWATDCTTVTFDDNRYIKTIEITPQ